jgi:hypothetical protein
LKRKLKKITINRKEQRVKREGNGGTWFLFYLKVHNEPQVYESLSSIKDTTDNYNYVTM